MKLDDDRLSVGIATEVADFIYKYHVKESSTTYNDIFQDVLIIVERTIANYIEEGDD